MAAIKPEFVSVDPKAIVADMVADYENRTNRRLNPADVEQLLIQGFAYRESIIRNAINNAGVQNLIEFATAPMLDYLAALVGVDRLPAQPAKCNILLTFVGNVTDIVIPEGTRIAAQDQKVFFRTVEEITVLAGSPNANVTAACETDGLDGNDYPIGQISIIMDPQPYLITATNTDITVGGSAEETDDRLRIRIKLAPSAFSNAGSTEAYKFFAFSASPKIVDVTVDSSIPGQVDIYPLLDDGTVTPAEIIDAVEAACNPDSVRPLTDTVVATAPTKIDYALTVNVTLLDDAIQADVEDTLNENLAAFVLEKRKLLGRDIKKTQLTTALSNGVESSIYDIALPGFVDISVDTHSFAFNTGFTINIVGTNPG